MVVDVFLGDRLLWSQGLLSRFLVTSPRSLAGERFWQEAADIDRAPIEAFDARVLEILRRPLPLRRGDNGRILRDEGLNLPAIPFSHASTAILRDFYNETEKRVGREGELEFVKSVANKGMEHACRLAGVLALLVGDLPREIPIQMTEAGIILAQHYIGESLRLRESASINPDLLFARRLLDWMSKEPGNLVAVRRILQYGPHALRDYETAKRILKVLEQHRYVEQVGETEIDGVHVKQAWRVLRKLGS